MEITKRQLLYLEMLQAACLRSIRYWADIVAVNDPLIIGNEHVFQTATIRKRGEKKTYKLNSDTIAKGMKLLSSGTLGSLDNDLHRYWRNAYADAANGEFAYTHDDVDCIVQIGLFEDFDTCGLSSWIEGKGQREQNREEQFQAEVKTSSALSWAETVATKLQEAYDSIDN